VHAQDRGRTDVSAAIGISNNPAMANILGMEDNQAMHFMHSPMEEDGNQLEINL
jgi:hypothetical protein